MTYRDGKSKSRSVLGLNTPYCHSVNPFGVADNKLAAGDLVLVKEYGTLQEAHKDGHEDEFPILMVYNDKEESRLRALGVTIRGFVTVFLFYIHLSSSPINTQVEYII